MTVALVLLFVYSLHAELHLVGATTRPKITPKKNFRLWWLHVSETYVKQTPVE